MSWNGYQLCDKDGCFELFIPTQLQFQRARLMGRIRLYCPKCMGLPPPPTPKSN